MFLELFRSEPRMVVRGRRAACQPPTQWFGSPVPYSGLQSSIDRPPVDVLFRLDCDDPLIGIRLSSARYLPLLCAVRLQSCPLAYRVISDRSVEILNLSPEDAVEELAGSIIRPHPIELQGHIYDADDPDGVLQYAGIFGFDHLTDAQYERVIELLERRGWLNIFEPDIAPCETIDEWLHERFVSPFIQQPPLDGCPNRDCPNNNQPASLRILAIYAEENEELWRGYHEAPQIVWQFCEQCEAMLVISECT